jgi:hypothetical protein
VAYAMQRRPRDMALLSALLSLLARKTGDLITAILGWSVTALFGQLPRTKKVALSAILLVSLFWPLLVVGIFVPSVSATTIALVPLDKWMGETAIRILSIVLAILVPLIVGAVSFWIAPPDARKAGLFRTVLNGYPLTLGYAASCLITAITVPVVKIASAARRWTDTHVFVQAKPGEYRAALEAIAGACEAAGVPVRIENVPRTMSLSTHVMKWFARGGLDPILVDEPKMLRADRLEGYLYPADLLLRGDRALVSKVRARIAESLLERHAFLVADAKSQDLASQIMRMWDVLARHQSPKQIGGAARSRLAEIQHALDRGDIPFDDWVSLDRSLRRVERELAPGEHILDRYSDHLAGVLADEPNELKGTIMETKTQVRPEPEVSVSTADLVRNAFDEARTLVRLEVELAKREVRKEIKQLEGAAIAFAVAAVTALLGLAMLLVAIVLAAGAKWEVALGIGGASLVVAGIAAFFGAGALPKKPLDKTRHRVEGDLQQLKERVA